MIGKYCLKGKKYVSLREGEREPRALSHHRYLDSGSAFQYYASKIPVCMKQPRISSRKQEHVELTIGRDVVFRRKSSGFERWEFLHNAVPKLDLSEIDPRTRFVGKDLSLPLMITGMTGGYAPCDYES